MKIKPLPSQEFLHEILDYSPDTGVFIHKWRKEISYLENKRWAGKKAGTRHKKQISIMIDWIPYPAHRLAWVYIYGNVLGIDLQVDHKNNDPFDNRIVNLRLATHSQNMANARKWKKKELPKGVSKNTKGYRVRLQVNKKVIHIGTFVTIEEASHAYFLAALKYHGEFARSA